MAHPSDPSSQLKSPDVELDELQIATVMRETLKALEYLHKEGRIHRDVKCTHR